MKSRCTFLCGAAVALLAVATVSAQEAKKEVRGAQEGPPVTKPSPEHDLLKQDAGMWDATIESFNEPGGKPDVSKGVETNTLICGGLWLVQDFKGVVAGMEFQGHGLTGYDPAKRKYVGTWVDSMTTSIAPIESTYDASKKTMTGAMEMAGPDGKPMKVTTVTTFKEDGTRVFTLNMPGPDGKDFTMMRITYTKRAGNRLQGVRTNRG
jgi:hypothetical protein